MVVARHEVGARGALIDPSQHPEWRQFLIQSALRRAGELERLRDLRDTIIRTPQNAVPADKPASQDGESMPDVAGLPSRQFEAAPSSDDITGSIDENPGATIPIEIGETSSTELPVIPTEERPPVTRLPALQVPAIPMPEATPPATKPVSETDGKSKVAEAPRRVGQQQRSRRKPAPPQQPAAPDISQVPPPFNILAAIFNGIANANKNQNAALSANASATTTRPAVTRQASTTPAVAP